MDSNRASRLKSAARANTLKLIAEARQRAQTTPLNDAEFTNRFAESRAAILEEATREGTVIKGGLEDGQQSVT